MLQYAEGSAWQQELVRAECLAVDHVSRSDNVTGIALVGHASRTLRRPVGFGSDDAWFGFELHAEAIKHGLPDVFGKLPDLVAAGSAKIDEDQGVLVRNCCKTSP